MTSDEEYVRPEILAETRWLAEHLGDPALRIIDARPATQYEQGHIPGSINLPGMPFNVPETLEIYAPDAFARLMGESGIGNGHAVVCYDETGPPAARLWWALTYYGHRGAQFLNGGIVKWAREKRPVTREVPSYPATTFEPDLQEGLRCTLDHAKACATNPDVLLWDVRSRGEYTGDEPRDNPPDRLGRLPGAVHLEWSDLVDTQAQAIKPAAEVRRLLAARGITPEREIVTY